LFLSFAPSFLSFLPAILPSRLLVVICSTLALSLFHHDQCHYRIHIACLFPSFFFFFMKCRLLFPSCLPLSLRWCPSAFNDVSRRLLIPAW
jgi:hypothetical protein